MGESCADWYQSTATKTACKGLRRTSDMNYFSVLMKPLRGTTFRHRAQERSGLSWVVNSPRPQRDISNTKLLKWIPTNSNPVISPFQSVLVFLASAGTKCVLYCQLLRSYFMFAPQLLHQYHYQTHRVSTCAATCATIRRPLPHSLAAYVGVHER